MNTPDAVMARIAQGRELAVAGDRGARRIFEEVWEPSTPLTDDRTRQHHASRLRADLDASECRTDGAE
ncbi:MULTISPECIES: hypothetical protein [unclassified Rhodococcus (in: high G+C Gram-positive bacteria)]|uniref:hypothetical protein n=1 Tax=unclassified Rhodococcus (in: high G+C Gram-positive bacteria) TaxID=192944 RepID=UPI0020788B16|nr:MULTISPECIES: hypothetical protein [unclassified Rhodococcus (in: high G+C Gram-positive bacteria)]